MCARSRSAWLQLWVDIWRSRMCTHMRTTFKTKYASGSRRVAEKSPLCCTRAATLTGGSVPITMPLRLTFGIIFVCKYTNFKNFSHPKTLLLPVASTARSLNGLRHAAHTSWWPSFGRAPSPWEVLWVARLSALHVCAHLLP
jgi:hypothetical protein